jgi:hypothetical protein
MSMIISPTKGPWLVKPNSCLLTGHLTIASTNDLHPVVATVPPAEDGSANFADAAILAAAPHMLEALINIHELINAPIDHIETDDINQIISDVLEKIYIESDVQS